MSSLFCVWRAWQMHDPCSPAWCSHGNRVPTGQARLLLWSQATSLKLGTRASEPWEPGRVTRPRASPRLLRGWRRPGICTTQGAGLAAPPHTALTRHLVFKELGSQQRPVLGATGGLRGCAPGSSLIPSAVPGLGLF